MDWVLPVMFVILLWWCSTAVLLYRCGQSARTFNGTLLATALVAATGGYLILISRDQPTVFGAYAGFTGALAIWALHETSYLLGYVTGPRPRACPDGATSVQRFRFGLQASLYHELAIVATVALIAALTWSAANRIALWTLVVFWLMRWSVKINIFLGVRNLHHEFWPTHLQYLQSYARTRSMNAWFPWSVGLALVAAIALVLQAASAVADPAQRTSAMLLLTILLLAMLEHVLLMLRVPDAVLWRVATRSRESAS